jgi:hypothetical protein
MVATKLQTVEVKGGKYEKEGEGEDCNEARHDGLCD